MRRALPIFSGLLILAGFELASGGLTDSVERMVRVAGELAAGNPVGVYLPAYVAGILGMAVGFMGLVVSVWSRFIGVRIVDGRSCPRCGSDTIRMRRTKRHRMLARLRDEEIQLRSCEKCEWMGLARVI